MKRIRNVPDLIIYIDEKVSREKCDRMWKSEAALVLGSMIECTDFNWAGKTASERFTKEVLDMIITKDTASQFDNISKMPECCKLMQNQNADVRSGAICKFLNAVASHTRPEKFKAVRMNQNHLGPAFEYKGGLLSDFWSRHLPSSEFISQTYRAYAFV